MAGVLRGKRAALLLLTSVELVVFLDVSIVNVALPAMGAALGLTVVGLAWVGTAYQVTFGGFQLGAGRATDVLGRRRMFRIGLVVFTLGSLFAGIATEPWVLVTARALQGVGAAILVPAELSLLTVMFTEPAAYRRAFGWWSAMGAVGAAGGVVLGGLIVELFSWPWIFLINVPIGLVGLLLSGRLLPPDAGSAGVRVRERLDLPGIVSGTAALLLLVYAVTVAAEGELDPFTGLLAVVGLAFGAVFVRVELRSADPLLPFRFFRNPDITGCTVASVLVGAAHVPAFVFLALYFQEVQDYTPLESGLAVLPVAAVNLVVSRTVVPPVLAAWGPRMVLTLGMAFLAAGLLMLSRLPVGLDFMTDYLPGALIFAVGLPAVFVGATLPAVKAVAESETGVVSAVVNTAQRIGAGLGVAVLAALAEARTGPAGGGDVTALNEGYRLTFLGAALLAAAGVAVGLWLVRRGRSADAEDGRDRVRAEPEGPDAPAAGQDRPAKAADV
ncbi:MFS transporter [Streptomyces sp. TRM 70361]|uniref:MFS transporter n=1 Tax=Streptomyces sp. TRM 70361 TaxID=3116553 RepID=UPI002E7C2A7F|nr:MFS transporter [Streptomyces sp. TRM 70361]MEE1938045.1 MFS transporter [Streptomyces sp. TRM 70361]